MEIIVGGIIEKNGKRGNDVKLKHYLNNLL